MDATNLITPSDTKTTIKHTHHFMIANVVVIVLSLIGTIGWIVYASEKKKYPYEKYVRNTGPPGTTKMSNVKLPGTGNSSAGSPGGSSGGSGGSLGATTPSSNTTPSYTPPSSNTPPSSGGGGGGGY